MASRPSIINRPLDAPEVRAGERIVQKDQVRAAAGIRKAAGSADKGERAFQGTDISIEIQNARTNEGRVQAVAVGCGKDDGSDGVKGVTVVIKYHQTTTLGQAQVGDLSKDLNRSEGIVIGEQAWADLTPLQ